MIRLFLVFTVALAPAGYCVQFDDLKGLLPGVDGNDPFVQEILRDGLLRLEAKLNEQKQNVRDEEIQTQKHIRQFSNQNALTEEFVARAHDLKSWWGEIDQEFQLIAQDFENAKKEELERQFQKVKIRFINQLVAQYEGLVQQLSSLIPESHHDISFEVEQMLSALETLKCSTQAAWRHTARTINVKLTDELNSDLQALSAGATQCGSLLLRDGKPIDCSRLMQIKKLLFAVYETILNFFR